MFKDEHRGNHTDNTALAAALDRAGYKKADMEIYPALVRYFRTGATMQSLSELAEKAFNEVNRRQSEQSSPQSAAKRPSGAGRPRTPDTFKPTEEEIEIALSRSENRISKLANHKRDIAEEAKKRAAAIVEKIEQRLIDRTFTSDGAVWGSVYPRELPGMVRDGARAAAIEKALGPLNAKQQRKPLRELMTDETFKTTARPATKAA